MKNRIRLMNIVSILFIGLVPLAVYIYSKDWSVVGWFTLFFIVLPTIVIIPVRYFVQKWRKSNPEAFAKKFPEAVQFDKDLRAEGNDFAVVGKAFSKTSFFQSILKFYKLQFLILIISIAIFIAFLIFSSFRFI